MKLLPVSLILILLQGASCQASNFLQESTRAASWSAFKSSFVSQDGRVRDPQQKNSSHSEGQAYGMLIALMQNDPETFLQIWSWSKNNLQIRRDKLLAWRWGLHSSGYWQIMDYNNATDGDIVTAWALLLANNRWGKPALKKEALLILEDILKNLRQQVPLADQEIQLLLPGYYGYLKSDQIKINPSYILPDAFMEFSRHHQNHAWLALHKSAKALWRAALLPDSRLPSDWLTFNLNSHTFEPAPLFGNEAIRIVLYQCWQAAHSTSLLPGIYNWLDLYKENKELRAKIGRTSHNYDAPAGFYAVAACNAEKLEKMSLAQELWSQAFILHKNEKENYFSSALLLLASGVPQ